MPSSLNLANFTSFLFFSFLFVSPVNDDYLLGVGATSRGANLREHLYLRVTTATPEGILSSIYRQLSLILSSTALRATLQPTPSSLFLNIFPPKKHTSCVYPRTSLYIYRPSCFSCAVRCDGNARLTTDIHSRRPQVTIAYIHPT